MAYRTISLFSPPAAPSRSSPTSFLVSAVVHIAAGLWIIFGFRGVPRVVNRSVPRHYAVRILNAPPLEPPPPPKQLASGRNSGAAQHGSSSPAAPAMAAASAAAMPSVAAELAKLAPQQQILIQPDAPPDVLLSHAPQLPLMLRWTPPKVVVKTITPAPPQKSIVAQLRPSAEPPNKELTPADLKMSSTNFQSAMAKLPPTTTSPIVVRAPEAAPHIPETSARQQIATEPAQIMSLSNLQVKEGPTPVPLANLPARPLPSGSLGTSPAVTNSGTAQGNMVSPRTGNAPGSSNSAGVGSSSSTYAAAHQPGSGNGSPSQTPGTSASGGTGLGAAGSGPGNAGTSGSGQLEAANGNGLSVSGVHLPKDGQYGVVIVGSTLQEKYPETANIWASRLVYTVYLHLGHGKAWILQYSVPSNSVAATTNSMRPEAPWPYDIVQPHWDPSADTEDAVMIHGFVNMAGKFERLAVVFPSHFAETKFVLNALQQWQFRPARQNGQLAMVEVLLIIPTALDE